MKSLFEQCTASDGATEVRHDSQRVGSLHVRLSRLALLALSLLPLAALAEVIPQKVNVPANMGQGIDTPVTISWLRTANDASATTLSVVLPPNVDFVQPVPPSASDCTYQISNRTVSCPIAAGTVVGAPGGSLGFSIRAQGVGSSFGLTARSSNSVTTATGTTSIRETGNLTVVKALVAPANGESATGAAVSFELRPNIAAGGSNLPEGAKIVITDQLPADAANVVQSITASGGNPVCETVAVANSTRRFTCTYSGPMTAAQLSAAKVTVVMQTNGLGTHTNNASIATENENYFDADPNDNADNASYDVVLGTDIEAQISFPGQPLEVNTAQNLVLTYQNHGPQTSTAGGTVATIIPDGFIIGILPAACVAEPNKQLTVSGETISGTLVTCDAGVVASDSQAAFTIPVTTPATGTGGRFPVVATPPASLKDWNQGNNAKLTPYQVNEPYTDIRLSKAKSPDAKAIAPGTAITTTLTVSNGTNSTSDAQYTPAQPLYVLDYMRPEEIDASFGANGLANITDASIWQCSVERGVTPPANNPGKTVRVRCQTTGTGTLERGNNLALSFQTQATAIVGQVTLSNLACAGASALTQLNLGASSGAQPADKETNNDCASAGGNLILTDVVNDTAWINIEKFSSVDNSTWLDEAANAPTLTADKEKLYWKIVVTTPSKADKSSQMVIPTLQLTDNVPGVLNSGTFRGKVTVVSSTVSPAANGSITCPPLAVGVSNLTCTAKNIAPGTQIELVLEVDRPLRSGTLTNIANVASPDAVLSTMRTDGKYGDDAAVIVAPRTDYRMTSKVVSPANEVLIGEQVSFTLTAYNYGPDAAPIGDFLVTDTLPVGTPTMSDVAYEILGVNVPGGSPLACNINHGTGLVSCVNTATIASQTTHTVTIKARIKKPANLNVAAGGVVYPRVTNVATVASNGAICQWLPGSSTACDDAASQGNNDAPVDFVVKVPTIDLQARKTQIYPNGRTAFVAGDQLRYRLTAFNIGPSQAENVEVHDLLTPPPGFSVAFDKVERINAAGLISGYTYKDDANVQCTKVGDEIVCKLHPSVASNTLDKLQMVTFEVVFNVLGDSSRPVKFDNRAYVCGDETTNYEEQGKCSADPDVAGNNMESVNDVLFPAADLEVVSKTTVTPGPVDIGQPVQYDIVVRNAVGSTVEKMRVIDTLPKGFEWVHDANHLTNVKANSGSAAVLGRQVEVEDGKPAAGTDNVCYLSSGPASITDKNEQQTITCDLGGNFPSGNGNTLTLTLWARTVPGVFEGGYVPVNHTNTVSIEPGRDENDSPTSVDQVPTNNNGTSTTQVRNATLGGLVFLDNNDNGDVDGSDTGIAGVAVTLTGTDLYGNAVSITVNTKPNGEYQFENLAPSNVAGYTITQTQPAGYAVNGTPQPNIVRPGRSGTSTNVSGTYAVSNTDTTSVIGGVVLGGGGVGVQFDFPEPLERTLSGYVYIDQDNDNVLSPDDAPIPNAKVYLQEVGSTDQAREATTNAQGFYEFRGLTAGKTYVLREPLPTTPAGLLNQPLAVNLGKIGTVLCDATCVTATTGAEDTISGIELVAGNGTEFNFGENITTAISGKVYLDRDDSGLQNGTEPGIPGVIITVTDSNGVEVWSGKTGPNGEYSVPNLIAGHDYTITETQPAGLKDGQEHNSNVITITKLPPTGSAGNNFGELAASLAGRVYLDVSNDGHTSTDPGLGNVQVTLSRRDGQPVVDVLGNTVSVLNTVADGGYAFIDLPAGDYIVTQQVAQPVYTPVGGTPVTTLNGTTTAGTVIDGVAGVATTVRATPSAITGVVLNAGGKSVDNNFGEILPVSASGVVFFDLNNNGVQEPGDAGIGGVDIRLVGTDDQGNPVDTTVPTNADGTFNFEGLRPGTYTLIEPTQPTGTAQGQTTAGQLDSSSASSGTASNGAAPESSKIAAIDLTLPGDISSNNLFAEIPTNSGIMGKVWRDTDNDGVIDPGEKGIANVELELTGIDINGAPITPVTVTTDADGNYSFLNLPPGTYKVVEKQQPAGTHDGKTKPGNIGGTSMGNGSVEGSATAQNPSFIDTITVAVGQVSVENNFGEIPVGSIAGFVYNDSNDDGIKQSGEGGFALVDVVLTGTDDLGNAINLTTKTDVNGHYVFENLRPGTYVVTEPTQPAETLNGLTTAGTIEGVRINAKTTGKETTPSVIDGIVLKPGNDSIDNNFGEIGDSPDMLVSKSSNTVKFTVNNVASYTIRVRNGGQQASKGEYTVKDRLPVGLNLAEVPSGNGWTCSGAVGGNRFECRSSEVLNAGVTSTSDITVKVNVTAEAAQAGTVNNAVLVEGGGENEFRTPTPAEEAAFEGDVTTLPVCDTAITQNVCRVPNEVQLAASVGGTVWFDIGSDDRRLDGGDERLQSWIVELIDSITGVVSQHTTTAVDGSYRFSDVVPGIRWNLQFRDPSSGVLWAWPVNQETAGGMGVACDSPRAITDSTTSACRVTENGTSQLQVVLEAGQHLPQQSLPVDPSGLVYDAVTRDPVPGSIVTLTPVGVCNGYDPMTAILNAAAGGYRVEGNAVSMTVGNNGYYQFMFGPAAPARCEFQLTVTPPGGYKFVSTLITPQDGSLSPLGDAGSSHLVQPQAGAPTGAVGTPTQYWLTLFAGSSTAGIVHNHIPLDTAEATGLVITKTGDRQTAEIGDTVQYTITVRQTAGSAMATLNIVDTLPRGFTYIDGTARVGGRALEEPFGKPGPRLGFNLGPINVGQQLALTYRVRVGVGAQQGDGINRAQAHGCSIDGGCIDPNTLTPVPGAVPSNRAEYRVRVTGGVFTEEACVLGKVFVDCNNNHLQDEEELGIPGVRLYFSNGTWVISDSEGKYSYCGLTPQSHTLKVDPSTLPAGSRLTTSSNRNLGDADSLFLDLKNGELHRADFIEGSCSNPLLEQVKARRTQGEVRAPETETGQSQLRFESKPSRAPQQATDSANQRPIVHPRPNPPSAAASQEVQP